jgi:hypothetical protein
VLGTTAQIAAMPIGLAVGFTAIATNAVSM